jgi:hypothetical protein
MRNRVLMDIGMGLEERGGEVCGWVNELIDLLLLGFISSFFRSLEILRVEGNSSFFFYCY